MGSPKSAELKMEHVEFVIGLGDTGNWKCTSFLSCGFWRALAYMCPRQEWSGGNTYRLLNSLIARLAKRAGGWWTSTGTLHRNRMLYVEVWFWHTFGSLVFREAPNCCYLPNYTETPSLSSKHAMLRADPSLIGKLEQWMSNFHKCR